MNCSDLALRLVEPADSSAADSSPDSDSLAAHLAGCDACREKVALLGRLPELARAEARPLSAGLRDRILAAAFEPAPPVALTPVAPTPVTLTPVTLTPVALTPVAPLKTSVPARPGRLRFLAPALLAACVALGAFLSHALGPTPTPASSTAPLFAVHSTPEPTTPQPTTPTANGFVGPGSPTPTPVATVAAVGSTAIALDEAMLAARAEAELRLAEIQAAAGSDPRANELLLDVGPITSVTAELLANARIDDPDVGLCVVAVANNSNTAVALRRLESLAVISSDECTYFTDRLASPAIKPPERRVAFNELAKCVSRASAKNRTKRAELELDGPDHAPKAADAAMPAPVVPYGK